MPQGDIINTSMLQTKNKQAGFTIVELLLACIIFPLVVVGFTNAMSGIQHAYNTAKQYNEMYAVLSACPEIDRALEYTSLTSSTNCFPNNTFAAEGGSGNIITYSPTVTVTDTTSLGAADPLKNVPDSKIIYISVPFLKSSAPPLQLRMLITRNGIGQQ
jgi:type II secretory pathway pseudopilin PulG